VPNAREVYMAIERLKRHKTQGIDQITAELIKAGCWTIRSEIHKLYNSIWNKEDWPEQWKESFIVPIFKKSDKTDCRDMAFCQLHVKFYPTSCCQV
jgi:hypothetical protein